MKVEADILFTLKALAGQQRGVLTTRDVEVLFGTSNRQLLRSRLAPFLKSHIILRFSRSFYILPGHPPEVILESLSQRLCPHSVISLGTILSRERLVGTFSKTTVHAVKAGKARTYTHAQLGTIIHFGFGGPSAIDLVTQGREYKNGLCYAEPEKALLDTLYFYQRGHTFFFNIYSDISVKQMDKQKYLRYLEMYPNKRFHTFARNYINERL